MTGGNSTAVHESERRFDAVWQSAADAMALSDPHGVVLAANPAYCDLYGYREDEVVGEPFTLIFPHEYRATAMEDYHRMFASTEVTPMVESVVRTADGSARQVEVRYAFITEAGTRTAMLSTIRDVTTRKQLEAAQAAFHRERDDFLLTASHDLKNPLTAIKGRTQLLRRRITRGEQPDNAALLEELAHIETTVSRMTTLIDELLNSSTVRLDPQQRPMDLLAMTRQIVSQEQRTTEHHTLAVCSEEGELLGTWDAARLQRVLENLLSNALTYSPGGGEIVVHVWRERVGGTDWAVLSVKDHGLGIPPDDLPRVFERFHRGSNVAGSFTGTGVGLAGSKQIVEQHGGTISVDSALGEGTTVTVRLPLP